MANEPMRVTDLRSPVHDTSAAVHEPGPGAGLCLSGGGYRAMVFHLGVLWRLNEIGYLATLERVSSVSGGSITAAALGLAWNQFAFDSTGVAKGFQDHVVSRSGISRAARST